MEDWVNEFIGESVDRIVSDHDEAIALLEQIETVLAETPKGLNFIEKCVEAFEAQHEPSVLQTGLLDRVARTLP